MDFKKCLRLFPLIFISTVCAYFVAHYDEWLPHRWQTYTANDGAFSIEFPGKPAFDTSQVAVDGGGSQTINLINASPSANTYYSIAYLNQENYGGTSPEDALSRARDGSLQKIQGRLISEKSMQVDGYPAVEIQANARGNSTFDARFVVTGHRLYMLASVASNSSDREATTLKRFMNSFHIERK